MSEDSEIVYSASDILERMKTENIASIRCSFLLITHTCFKKDIDDPNQVCLMYWDIYNLGCIVFAALIILIIAAMFISNQIYNCNFEITLCVGSILIVILTIVFWHLQKRYCYIDEENVTVSRYAPQKHAKSGKALLSLPTQSCQIGFRYNLFLHLWTLFLRNKGDEHVLSYNLQDVKLLRNLMDKKTPLSRPQQKRLVILSILLIATIGIAAVSLCVIGAPVVLLLVLLPFFILGFVFVISSFASMR